MLAEKPRVRNRLGRDAELFCAVQNVAGMWLKYGANP